MPDGFVQQDTRPAGPQNDLHCACWGRDRFKVHQRNPQSFAGLGLPVLWVDQAVEPQASTAAGAAAFPATVLFDDDRDIYTCHGANIADLLSIGTQNDHFLVRSGQGRRNLNHPRVQIAGKGIYLAQGLDLDGQGGSGDRIIVCIKLAVGWRRSIGQYATAFTHGQPRGFDSAGQGTFGDFRGMGVAGDFAAHRTQTESLGGVVRSRLESPVIEHQSLGPTPFQEQFAIIRAESGLVKLSKRKFGVENRLKRAEFDLGHMDFPFGI